MATAVLLPQDCLPSSKSRQKSKFSGTACYAPRPKRGTARAFVANNTTSLYPGPSRGHGRMGWTGKASEPEIGDPESCEALPMGVGDEDMGFKCHASQGKSGTMKEVFHGKVHMPRVHDADLHLPRIRDVLASEREAGGYLCMKDPKIGGDQHPGVSKLMNTVQSNNRDAFRGLFQPKSPSQKLGLRAMAEHTSFRSDDMVGPMIFKPICANQLARNDSIVPGGVACLRRASTDPHIVSHLVCQQGSDAIRIPYHSNRSKSVNGFTQSASVSSCPERWAGPAYSSSPPPSSLPLPTFSLPIQRTVSAELSPFFVESRGSSDKSQLQVLISTPEVDFPAQGGPNLDVVLATRSLRRLLKLDS